MPSRCHLVRLRVAAWGLLICGALCALPTCLAAQTSLEYEVKGAFLLNFAKFVDWPPNAFAGPNAPIAICILGKDPFGSDIDDLVRGESVNGRKVEVRRIDGVPARQTCQILYSQESGKPVADTLSALGGGVLTVGEGENFLRDGGMIAFVIENRRVRFDIGQRAAEAASLKLSSKLLAVARAVAK